MRAGNDTKDAYRTCNGGALGKDAVGAARDVVTARCGIVAHRHGNRLARGLEVHHGLPDLFAAEGAAAR